MKIDPYFQRRNCSPLNALQRCIDCVDIARRSSASRRQTTVTWQNKPSYTHDCRARLSFNRLMLFMETLLCPVHVLRLQSPVYRWCHFTVIDVFFFRWVPYRCNPGSKGRYHGVSLRAAIAVNFDLSTTIYRTSRSLCRRQLRAWIIALMPPPRLPIKPLLRANKAE